jgi:hypothetical protein
MIDSTAQALLHIQTVNKLLIEAATELLNRAVVHDKSKLEEPEKSQFDAATEKLKGLTYGSKEYHESLKELSVALNHHYAHNRHHPEHHKNGVNDMSLFDIIEMLLDWYAATQRHADGDIRKSIELNKVRFGLSDQLVSILHNTINQITN